MLFVPFTNLSATSYVNLPSLSVVVWPASSPFTIIEIGASAIGALVSMSTNVPVIGASSSPINTVSVGPSAVTSTRNLSIVKVWGSDLVSSFTIATTS